MGYSSWGHKDSDMTERLTHTSDQISRSVVSDSLGPHESQHARPPCAYKLEAGKKPGADDSPAPSEGA